MKDEGLIGKIKINKKEFNNIQDDVDKIEKLSLINANARYELLSANQQLIDFQMNRYIMHAKEKKIMKLVQ